MLTREDEFRARLREEGQLKEFVARRREWEAAGYTKKESWKFAAEEFGFGEPALPDWDDGL